MSKILRISDEAYSKLHQITKNTGLSNQEVIDKALQNLERETILKQANEAYAAMKKDQKQWQEHQEELVLWETTLEDGLKDE
jgi:DNA-binding transcriptional regulator YhcF (GntR family)